MVAGCLPRLRPLSKSSAALKLGGRVLHRPTLRPYCSAPPVVTGPTPSIPAVTKPASQLVRKHAHGSVYELQHLNSFLGFSSKRTHPSAFNYLLGDAGGQAIINPEDTLVAMRSTLHILKSVSFRGGRILFVSTQPMLARLCRIIGEQTGQYYLAKRWVPGLLTNWQKSREHVHAKLRLDPRIKAAGRVRFSDLQKQNYYRGLGSRSFESDGTSVR